jgi:hypothetical protein
MSTRSDRLRSSGESREPRGRDMTEITMQPHEIDEILDRPLSRELLARDLTRLGYVAKDRTPRTVSIAFTWNGSKLVMCTTKNAPKITALRHNPALALTIDTEAHPPKIRAHPRPGRARRRRHPGRVPPDERHLRDDARGR